MTLKLFSAFSGYDSVLMALTRLSLDYSLLKVKLVGWCDIDPDAIVCHNVNFPEYCDLNYGDISRIKWFFCNLVEEYMLQYKFSF